MTHSSRPSGQEANARKRVREGFTEEVTFELGVSAGPLEICHCHRTQPVQSRKKRLFLGKRGARGRQHSEPEVGGEVQVQQTPVLQKTCGFLQSIDIALFTYLYTNK